MPVSIYSSMPLCADWGFDNIRAEDRGRADRLEVCEPADRLIPALVQSIRENGWEAAVKPSKRDPKCRRAVVQFRVEPELYDWFYNARTGYRAQFWISPEHGIRFNQTIVDALADELSRRIDRFSRGSIRHPEAKIWIFEEDEALGPGGIFALAHAQKTAKLVVPRWAGEGVRAPFPTIDQSWLELKGAFLRRNGVLCPSEKLKDERARALHQTGWT